MYGHWIYLEELPEKFLESDISGTLETEGIKKNRRNTSVQSLILESKAAREKL